MPELEFFYSLPEDDELKTVDILNYLECEYKEKDEFWENMQKRSEVFKFEKFITNENGEKFELTVSPRENGGSSIGEDGILKFEGMFDVTKYNASDELVLHIDYHGKTADIKLKKVGK